MNIVSKARQNIRVQYGANTMTVLGLLSIAVLIVGRFLINQDLFPLFAFLVVPILLTAAFIIGFFAGRSTRLIKKQIEGMIAAEQDYVGFLRQMIARAEDFSKEELREIHILCKKGTEDFIQEMNESHTSFLRGVGECTSGASARERIKHQEVYLDIERALREVEQSHKSLLKDFYSDMEKQIPQIIKEQEQIIEEWKRKTIDGYLENIRTSESRIGEAKDWLAKN